MGQDSPFVIFFQKERLETVLQYLSKWCHVHSNTVWREQSFPTGKVLSLPFELKTPERDGHIWYFYDTSPKVFETFNITLEFEEDTKIYEYYFTDLLEGLFEDKMDYYRTENGKYWVGGIDVGIRDYSDKVEGVYMMYFQAVTSNMSMLFGSSDSIKNSFRAICTACGVWLCFFYDEGGGGFELLQINGKNVEIRLAEYKCYNSDKSEFTMPQIILNQIKHNLLP